MPLAHSGSRLRVCWGQVQVLVVGTVFEGDCSVWAVVFADSSLIGYGFRLMTSRPLMTRRGSADGVFVVARCATGLVALDDHEGWPLTWHGELQPGVSGGQPLARTVALEDLL